MYRKSSGVQRPIQNLADLQSQLFKDRRAKPAAPANHSVTSMQSPTEIVRACFAAYEKKDRAAIDALLAPDFTFSSPLDDNISRERYFERCWPNSEHLGRFEIEKLFVQGDEAFVQY